VTQVDFSRFGRTGKNAATAMAHATRTRLRMAHDGSMRFWERAGVFSLFFFSAAGTERQACRVTASSLAKRPCPAGKDENGRILTPEKGADCLLLARRRRLENATTMEALSEGAPVSLQSRGRCFSARVFDVLDVSTPAEACGHAEVAAFGAAPAPRRSAARVRCAS
jgi:hypothetical protein